MSTAPVIEIEKAVDNAVPELGETVATAPVGTELSVSWRLQAEVTLVAILKLVKMS